MTAPENIKRRLLPTRCGTPSTPADCVGRTTRFFASDVFPNLDDGDVNATIYFLDNGAAVGIPTVGTSVNAVSGLLTAQSLINGYATGGVASTSWVVTFPTKHLYTDAVGPIAPFSDMFQSDGQSCDNIA
jgi:hypothetical protein